MPQKAHPLSPSHRYPRNAKKRRKLALNGDNRDSFSLISIVEGKYIVASGLEALKGDTRRGTKVRLIRHLSM